MKHQVKIQSSGHVFSVDADETLLDAALRQSIGLPYGCRNGACGSCIGELVSGEIHYPKGAPRALKDSKNPKQTVFCQAIPQSDLIISAREIETAPDIELKQLPCRAEQFERLSEDVMRVMLRPPASDRMQFLAGQYIEFILKDGRRRAFSIANAPHQDELLELHIRHIPGGSFTGHIFEEMQEKAMMRIEGPLGSFYLREESTRPIILMGGGTGFAPLKGMLEHAFYTHIDRPIHLFWGAYSEVDLYLNDLPKSWLQKHPNFAYTPVLEKPENEVSWKGATGLVTEELSRQFPDLKGFDIYMSGAPAMIEAATSMFAALSAELDYMYSDAFEFAKDILDKVASSD